MKSYKQLPYERRCQIEGLKKTGTVLVVLQTSAPSNCNRNKDILRGIVKSVNVARDGEF